MKEELIKSAVLFSLGVVWGVSGMGIATWGFWVSLALVGAVRLMDLTNQ